MKISIGNKYPVIFLVCILALFAGHGVCSAKPKKDKKPKYITVNSRHFRLSGTVSKKVLTEYGKYMDALARDYYRLMKGLGGDSKFKFNIHIWNLREEYIAEVGSQFANSGGIFMAHKKLLATFVGGRPTNSVLSVLRHECFHQFFFKFVGGGRPTWINEGLAVYFQNSTLVDKKMILGDVPFSKQQRLRQLKKSGELPSLGTMLKMSHQQWNMNLQSGAPLGHIQYVTAWSIVHFLRHGAGSNGRKRFGTYMKAINKGMSAVEATRKSFGGSKSLKTFQKKWLTYIDEMKPGKVFASRNNLGSIIKLMNGLRRRGVDFSKLQTTEQFLELCREKSKLVTPEFDESIFICPGDKAKDPKTGYTLSFKEIDDKKHLVLTSHHFKDVTVKIVYEKVDGRGVQLWPDMVKKEKPPKKEKE